MKCIFIQKKDEGKTDELEVDIQLNDGSWKVLHRKLEDVFTCEFRKELMIEEL